MRGEGGEEKVRERTVGKRRGRSDPIKGDGENSEERADKKGTSKNLKTISRSFYCGELLYSTVTDLALQTKIMSIAVYNK